MVGRKMYISWKGKDGKDIVIALEKLVGAKPEDFGIVKNSSEFKASVKLADVQYIDNLHEIVNMIEDAPALVPMSGWAIDNFFSNPMCWITNKELEQFKDKEKEE